jgi:hypothetical protein
MKGWLRDERRRINTEGSLTDLLARFYDQELFMRFVLYNSTREYVEKVNQKIHSDEIAKYQGRGLIEKIGAICARNRPK